MLQKLLMTAILLAIGYQGSKPDIDLTAVVPKNRVRAPATASSSGGVVGQEGAVAERNNPTEVRLLSLKVSRGAETDVVFEIQVKNIASGALNLPVNPNLAEFESKSAAIPYAYESAYIALFVDTKGQGAWFFPGISVYGSDSVNGSFDRLETGQSVRIRARVPLRLIGADAPHSIPRNLPIRAVLLRQRAFVAENGGVLNQDSEQISPQVTSLNSIPLPQQ